MISVVEDGITFTSSCGSETLLKWSNVVEISAFKVDNITSDLICLEFIDKNKKLWLIHEESSEFPAVEQQMALKLKLEEPLWRGKVSLPAFANNNIIIYKNESAI